MSPCASWPLVQLNTWQTIREVGTVAESPVSVLAPELLVIVLDDEDEDDDDEDDDDDDDEEEETDEMDDDEALFRFLLPCSIDPCDFSLL